MTSLIPLLCHHYPLNRFDLQSVIQKNTVDLIQEQEWELEWNTLGAASGLSKAVSDVIVAGLVTS